MIKWNNVNENNNPNPLLRKKEKMENNVNENNNPNPLLRK